MNLDFFKDREKKLNEIKQDGLIDKFITELAGYLKEKKENNNEQKVNELREEDCLYQVVDLSLNGVYLQNTNNNMIFEEVNIAENLKNVISNDYILRYKNGTYIFEKELTDDFFRNMVDINKYKQIQEKFIKESNILDIDSETKYNVLWRKEDYTILKYKNGRIKVPNVLLPYFINNQSTLYYKNGKFHKDLSK